jgi:feruloyl-CoA synthase
VQEGGSGDTYIRADQPLGSFANSMGERLLHWAAIKPEQTLFARRSQNPDGSRGDWQHLTYRDALASARQIASALLARGLSAERPVAILSENDLEHAQMALGCLLAGVPYCPISPAYSLVSQDFEKLRHVVKTLTPGLVFASDAKRYGRAIEAAIDPAIELVLTSPSGVRFANPVKSWEQFIASDSTPINGNELARVTPDTIAKFLFTSGSTKLPKAVINTHRMWCSNQQQMAQSMPVLTQQPPILVDWLPWNHTFGGNHNFGMVVYHGGTLYIDDGKPTPALMAETLRNLREIAPTLYFNVPTGFEAIAHAMKTDAALRKTLLSRVQMFFYAGAALAQPIWDSLFATQEAEIGERIAMTTGLGMTESGPYGLFVTSANVQAGHLGVPTPGLNLRLVPRDGKLEIRYKGPNITPGYWRNAEATSGAFDEEGFFKTGDAVCWIDESNQHLGLRFDGRIDEDFKLATGTFVSVGPLRSKIIAAGAPYVQDVVITGLNGHEVGALIFPTAKVRELAALDASATLQEVLESAPVQSHFSALCERLANASTGTSTRVACMHLLHEPPSIDRGEVTDKGSINQRAVLTHRAALVQAMHDRTLAFTIMPDSKRLQS